MSNKLNDIARKELLNKISDEDHKEAIEFAGSPRGCFIISQALQVAIRTLSDIDRNKREVSNINDMKYLRDNLFNIYPMVERAMEISKFV